MRACEFYFEPEYFMLKQLDGNRAILDIFFGGLSKFANRVRWIGLLNVNIEKYIPRPKLLSVSHNFTAAI
jgi:hypothetical protein